MQDLTESLLQLGDRVAGVDALHLCDMELVANGPPPSWLMPRVPLLRVDRAAPLDAEADPLASEVRVLITPQQERRALEAAQVV